MQLIDFFCFSNLISDDICWMRRFYGCSLANYKLIMLLFSIVSPQTLRFISITMQGIIYFCICRKHSNLLPSALVPLLFNLLLYQAPQQAELKPAGKFGFSDLLLTNLKRKWPCDLLPERQHSYNTVLWDSWDTMNITLFIIHILLGLLVLKF